MSQSRTSRQYATAFGSHQTKNASCWDPAAPSTLLEGSPSDSLLAPDTAFFLNLWVVDNIRLERTGGACLVQSPAQSFTIRSGCSRSRPAELLKVSKTHHSNLGHLFQCLTTTFIGKNFIKSSCPIHIYGLPLSIHLPHLSVLNILVLHTWALQRCFYVHAPPPPTPRFC